MFRLVRCLLVCAAFTVGASALLANDLPSPIFPPDPWESSIANSDIPSPIFPPDPWE
jgi:hypothetical protein